MTKRADINKTEEYINAARSIEDKGIYAYFHAYIKYDYYERKGFITSPNYRELSAEAGRLGVSEHDIRVLFGLMRLERPENL